MSEPRLLPRPSVVFLDLGDTLIRAHPSWSAVYRRVLADHGVDVDADQLRAALEHTFGNNGGHVEGPFEASEAASYQRLKGFDTQVLAYLGAPVPPDAFFRSLEAAFAERAAWWVFEDVPGALQRCRTPVCGWRSSPTGAGPVPELLHTLELARHFEAVVISDRVGYLKPSAGIFQHALDVMGVAAADAIHVGDSMPADVAGARAVGIQPVLIERLTRGHGTTTPDTDPDLAGCHPGDGPVAAGRSAGHRPAGRPLAG